MHRKNRTWPITVLMSALLFALPLSLQAKSAGQAQSIAAIVNQDAISTSDVMDRLKLIMASSGLRDDPDIREKLIPQILTALIEEQLKLQEAKRLNITVTQAEIDAAFASLSAQNKMSADQFRGALTRAGINLETMYRQIRAQLGWGKIIQQTMRPQVSVSDADVDDALARMAANKGKTEFLVAEILLPVGPQAKDADVAQLARKLIGEINKGAPFLRLAQQFSAAPGASQGGDRGWIQEGQLAAELEFALNHLEKNHLSDPVRLADGYHILLLRDKRVMSDETLPPREAVINTLGVQRLERLQARHLLDLKSSAFIETRVKS